MCVEDNYNVACALLRSNVSDEKGYSGDAPQMMPDSAEPKANRSNTNIY